MTVVRALAGILGGMASLLWLYLTYVVLDSRFSTDPAGDPHGYGLMFGSVMAPWSRSCFHSHSYPAVGHASPASPWRHTPSCRCCFSPPG
jgi:hypothetical protein